MWLLITYACEDVFQLKVFKQEAAKKAGRL